MDGRSPVNAVVTDPVTMAYHELRSPLALVATAAQSVASDCRDDDLRSRCLSIVRAAERMLRTAGRVMEVAQASNSGEIREFEPVSVLEDVLADYRALGVPVCLEVDEPRFARVRSVPEHFEALICSLIGNATDHGTEGEPILVSVKSDAYFCDVTIANIVATSDRHLGIGLGSYIGERLASHLSATLRVERLGNSFAAHVSIPVFYS